MDSDAESLDGQDPPPSADAVKYAIHHILLPRKLPQASDYNASNESLLIDLTKEALQDFQNVVKNEQRGIVDSAIAALEHTTAVRDLEGNINEAQLHERLGQIVRGAPDDFLMLEIKAQNAGILVTRTTDDVVFESFELAPCNEDSMQKGRLVRSFPGLAVSIPIETIEENGLLISLSRTISKMSSQAAPDTQPQTRKAGHSHDET
ncbi:hypothetical protein OPT61_g6918 [Boeremia exigua]|uniref:Uncharacterized protein n=1 Tax=Boeremia exigua TaxID=749465 RepID=A0ACC2I5B1_9PLEO|nr:hypothetical protein OPT61_g6918 [Boeremia exigua]